MCYRPGRTVYAVLFLRSGTQMISAVNVHAAKPRDRPSTASAALRHHTRRDRLSVHAEEDPRQVLALHLYG